MYIISTYTIGEVLAQGALIETGAIFLDRLFCTENDAALLSCKNGLAAVGLTTCDHSEDVWIRCNGIYRTHALLGASHL